ncbi:hypothetical protein KY366_04290 [Candidatus Woesearchaeota archaeon]|nr:hypothetical protein [Candidatus Woesearchaeota archaeon]
MVRRKKKKSFWKWFFTFKPLKKLSFVENLYIAIYVAFLLVAFELMEYVCSIYGISKGYVIGIKFSALLLLLYGLGIVYIWHCYKEENK